MADRSMSITLPVTGEYYNQQPASAYINAQKHLLRRRKSVIEILEVDIKETIEPQLTPLRYEVTVEKPRIVREESFCHVGTLLRRRSSLQILKPTLDSILKTFSAIEEP